MVANLCTGILANLGCKVSKDIAFCILQNIQICKIKAEIDVLQDISAFIHLFFITFASGVASNSPIAQSCNSNQRVTWQS